MQSLIKFESWFPRCIIKLMMENDHGCQKFTWPVDRWAINWFAYLSFAHLYCKKDLSNQVDMPKIFVFGILFFPSITPSILVSEFVYWKVLIFCFALPLYLYCFCCFVFRLSLYSSKRPFLLLSEWAVNVVR